MLAWIILILSIISIITGASSMMMAKDQQDFDRYFFTGLFLVVLGCAVAVLIRLVS